MAEREMIQEMLRETLDPVNPIIMPELDPGA